MKHYTMKEKRALLPHVSEETPDSLINFIFFMEGPLDQFPDEDEEV